MNIEWAETFLEILRKGSINGAAESLFLSQSTVSNRILLLEKELNVTLFDRSRGKKAIELTKEGRAFVPIARKLTELQTSAQSLGKTVSPVIRISAIESLNHSVFHDFYKSLRISFPDTRLTIFTNRSEDIYRLLSDQEIDLGFPSISLNRAGCKVTPLFSQNLYIVQKKSPSSSDRHVIHPRELDPKKEICQLRETVLVEWHKYWWESDVHTRVDSISTLLDFLMLPGFWAIVPYATIRVLPSDVIQVYQLSDPPPARTCYLVERESPHEPELMDALHQRIRDMLDDADFMRSHDLIRCSETEL